MATRGQFKCAGCGYIFDGSMKVVVNKKNYCPNCGNSLAQEAKGYRPLTDYIWNNLRVKDIPSFSMPMLTTFIKQIKDKYGIGNWQLLYTLRYMYEFEENDPPEPFTNENSIYNIIRYYQRAKEFWSVYKSQSTSDEEAEHILSAPYKKVTITRSFLNSQYQKKEKNRRDYFSPEELSIEDIVDDGLSGEGLDAWGDSPSLFSINLDDVVDDFGEKGVD